VPSATATTIALIDISPTTINIVGIVVLIAYTHLFSIHGRFGGREAIEEAILGKGDNGRGLQPKNVRAYATPRTLITCV